MSRAAFPRTRSYKRRYTSVSMDCRSKRSGRDRWGCTTFSDRFTRFVAGRRLRHREKNKRSGNGKPRLSGAAEKSTNPNSAESVLLGGLAARLLEGFKTLLRFAFPDATQCNDLCELLFPRRSLFGFPVVNRLLTDAEQKSQLRCRQAQPRT